MWLLVAPRAAKGLMVMRASGSSRPILASTPRNGVVRGSQPETTARKSSRRLTRRCPVALQAAQTFIRWAHLGVWERLLLLAQERGVQLGMTFLDGTSIRAHHKAAGAEKRGPTARREMSVRRWAARVAATAPRRA